MAIEPDINKVEQETGLKRRTLYDIKKRGITDPEFAQLHQEQKKLYVMNGWDLAFELIQQLKGKMPNATFKDIAIAFGIVSEKTLAASGEGLSPIQINQDNRSITLVDTSGWSVNDKKRFLADPSYRPMKTVSS